MRVFVTNQDMTQSELERHRNWLSHEWNEDFQVKYLSKEKVFCFYSDNDLF